MHQLRVATDGGLQKGVSKLYDDFTRCTSRYFENCYLLVPEECLRSHITMLMQKGQSCGCHQCENVGGQIVTEEDSEGDD